MTLARSLSLPLKALPWRKWHFLSRWGHKYKGREVTWIFFLRSLGGLEAHRLLPLEFPLFWWDILFKGGISYPEVPWPKCPDRSYQYYHSLSKVTMQNSYLLYKKKQINTWTECADAYPKCHIFQRLLLPPEILPGIRNICLKNTSPYIYIIQYRMLLRVEASCPQPQQSRVATLKRLVIHISWKILFKCNEYKKQIDISMTTFTYKYPPLPL